MTSTPDVTIDVLAITRLTRLVTIDDFPPIEKARDRFVERVGDDSSWAELVGCPWCASWWIALAVGAVRRRRWWRPVAVALAASEVAGFLGIMSKNLNGDRDDIAAAIDGHTGAIVRAADAIVRATGTRGVRDVALAELFGRLTGLERDRAVVADHQHARLVTTRGADDRLVFSGAVDREHEPPEAGYIEVPKAEPTT